MKSKLCSPKNEALKNTNNKHTLRTNFLSTALVSENIIVVSELHVVFGTLRCILHIN